MTALAWIEACSAAIDRLIEIDRRSRVMLDFMTAHMKETTGALGIAPIDYFRRSYEHVAQEFLQMAENSFVTHHSLRVLYFEWMESIERLRGGVVGRRLAEIAAPMPPFDRNVVPPASPIVPFHYEAVRDAVRMGTLPPPAAPVNRMMEPAECKMFSGDETIFGRLGVHSANDWAEEAVILWDLLRRTVALESAAVEANDDPEELRAAVESLDRRYEAWRLGHVESTRVHTELYRLFSAGMFEFFGKRFGTWTIAPMLMRELYLEVAAEVAKLRGDARVPIASEPRYWRRTPWTPEWFRPGGVGLPPF